MTDQPPTREQIAEALYLDDADHEDWSWATEDNSLTRAAYLKNADAVLALFPQPTPSAEPAVVKKVEQELEYRVRTAVARYRAANLTSASTVVNEEVRQGRAAIRKILTPTPAAEPVSIADMAPGTLFTCEYQDWATNGRPKRRYLCAIARSGSDSTRLTFLDPAGASLHIREAQSSIDPSTIRDVTPPTTTPGSES